MGIETDKAASELLRESGVDADRLLEAVSTVKKLLMGTTSRKHFMLGFASGFPRRITADRYLPQGDGRWVFYVGEEAVADVDSKEVVVMTWSDIERPKEGLTTITLEKPVAESVQNFYSGKQQKRARVLRLLPWAGIGLGVLALVTTLLPI